MIKESERLLYYFSMSPASRKVRMLLIETELDFNLIEKDPWNMDTSFAKINPAMDVPVLFDKSLIIVAGYPITEYIVAAYDQSRLIGETLEKQNEIRRIISWFDIKFYNEVSQYIIHDKIKCFFVKNTYPNSTNLIMAAHNINYHLEYIDFLLRKRSWLAGKDFSLADISALSHLSILDYWNNIKWFKASSRVKTWYEAAKAKPCFKAVLKDRVSKSPPPDYYESNNF